MALPAGTPWQMSLRTRRFWKTVIEAALLKRMNLKHPLFQFEAHFIQEVLLDSFAVAKTLNVSATISVSLVSGPSSPRRPALPRRILTPSPPPPPCSAPACCAMAGATRPVQSNDPARTSTTVRHAPPRPAGRGSWPRGAERCGGVPMLR